ncbi:inositol polyphosphate phosphatase [Grosmannia clavigera kw1407]|uniref:Inositol polyphosphate phosphatase n=1 Tax=Grosmannia clavigera (strain kw1407 / UAMH 11150) TaxID=655863 RepID=F0XFR3_GROCL|nr:inositol polyphosphate phosphatase [Grosmannia clavigera kw1407]EFX04276.1 inositol polyphosphate phosphatase [Grosmannia clavigera kw1407]
MGPPDENGPDGSSIKPVSSLRARFENMSKTTPDSLPSQTTPALPPLPSRSISPGPKPERLRDAVATPTKSNRLSYTPLPKPKPAVISTAHSQAPDSLSTLRPSSDRIGLPPPLSPRPIPPPSLLVQPPQSPPKGRANHIASASNVEPSTFLNPDAVKKGPLSPSSSPRPYKIPSRPITPSNALDLLKSPRPSPSRAPSPPPPRRSAELKREREREREKDGVHHAASASTSALIPAFASASASASVRPVPPSIVGRADKPKIPSHHISYSTVESGSLSDGSKSVADSRSPFSSPPSSSDSQLDDQPPSLPMRPRQQVQMQAQQPPPRPKVAATAPRTFEPPPVHHAVVNRRMGREQEAPANGSSRGPVSSMGPPPLPSRPQNNTETIMRSHSSVSSRSRPLINTHHVGGSISCGISSGISSGINSLDSSGLSSAQKRVVSNPTSSTQQFHPPPSRARHGRSMTVDRNGGRVPDDTRTPPSSSTSLSTSVSAYEGTASIRSANTDGADSLMSPSTSTRSTESPAITFPDAANVNRRPAYAKQGVAEVNARSDCRVFDVCGELVCTTGHFTRVWTLMDGELLLSLAHGENVRATAIAFRPGAHVDDEATHLWIGNAGGELMEVDLAAQCIVASKPGAHNRHEIVKIHRHFNELWTLDDGGALYVWGPDEDGGVPSLGGNQHQSYRVPRGHTFSMVVDDELWHAVGRDLRVFLPTMDGSAQFQVSARAMCLEGAGEICAGTTLVSDDDRVFFGHADGKVSIYSRRDYSCVSMVSLGSYKVNTLQGAGSYIWAGFNTGRMCVYNPGRSSAEPWAVKKEWQAHETPVVKLLADRASAFRTGQLQVVSLGADNLLRIWDGLLQDDWTEEMMQDRDQTYCDFDTLRGQVMTWNAGASTPSTLRYAEDDARFMQDLLQSSESPDILVFGFQELVDLEDKTATAKRFLKPKKKEGADQERMSHQYRDWRDFLVRSLDDYVAGELYHLLQTAHMVGLFTCVFVKADLRGRIRGVASTEVKRGMGGLHGNKGAIAVRFLVDDTSLCLVNCHLAAGQSQAAHRHNDIAAILESESLPVERDLAARIDNFVGGGDGSMILDHELCVLNGDLNYRIDTMSRDTVVAAVRAGNLTKLLERDQLLVARRRNAAFRLRAFEELPITFAPTYKYDVGTDTYDTSEKKRSPAWCDRLLFRGGRASRVRQLDYRRHEVRVSDHRPVTGQFAFTVKRVDAKRRAVAWMESQQLFEDHRDQVLDTERLQQDYVSPDNTGMWDIRQTIEVAEMVSAEDLEQSHHVFNGGFHNRITYYLLVRLYSGFLHPPLQLQYGVK